MSACRSAVDPPRRWGESAGAFSVGLHLVTNGGDPEGLFRAAFMQSGSPIPIGDISEGQPTYDFLVSETGCGGAKDTLECLRGVPYATLKAAIDMTPGPRMDPEESVSR